MGSHNCCCVVCCTKLRSRFRYSQNVRIAEGTQCLRGAGKDSRHQEGGKDLTASVHQAPLGLSEGEQTAGSKILGTKKGEKISRPQCTKRLWAYLKENKLQDPENKQWFTPDETMAPIFGTEKIKCFSMAKYLKEHLTNPGK